MIDEENTVPRPVTSEKTSSASTIEVPAIQPSTTQSVGVQTLPFVSIPDLLALKLVSDPQLSPDGAWIAYTLQQCNAATNTTSSAIWIVDTKSGKASTPRQVTNIEGSYHDLMPRWSPDGQWLAFLSDRSGLLQIHLLPLQGGEAQQISHLPQGVTEYSWRPDGKALLAHSGWKASDENQAPNVDDMILIYTRLDETWDGVGFKYNRYQQLWLIPLDDKAERLTSEPLDFIQSCWSPDGTEIAFCANRQPDSDLSVSKALWVLNLASKQMRLLSPEEGLAQLPAWSPDGKHIAYYYTADQTETGNITPWIVDAQGNNAPHPASSHFPDNTCIELIVDELHFNMLVPPRWYPDSQSLLITVQERGQVHLYAVDTEQERVTALTSGNGCYISPHLSSDGQTIAAIRTDWFTPGDIWSMNGNGEQKHRLTGVNDALLRNRQLVRPKRISWKSFDGLEIEGWLYLPPLPEGTKAPLILEIHGGPSLAWGDSYVHEFQILAGKGFAVLAANPRGSTGYGEAFCRKTINNWGGDDFRDLMAGLDSVIATEAVDGSRLGIAGLSYGGYMTNWAITQTNRFKAAVSRNGISYLPSSGMLSDQALWFDMVMSGDGNTQSETFQRNASALPFADRISTPLLLLHSENDLRCPFSESLQLFVALRKRKQAVELVRYRGVGHLIDWPDVGLPLQRTDRLQRTLGWFEHFLAK